jgi:hypothetical protein
MMTKPNVVSTETVDKSGEQSASGGAEWQALAVGGGGTLPSGEVLEAEVRADANGVPSDITAQQLDEAVSGESNTEGIAVLSNNEKLSLLQNVLDKSAGFAKISANIDVAKRAGNPQEAKRLEDLLQQFSASFPEIAKVLSSIDMSKRANNPQEAERLEGVLGRYRAEAEAELAPVIEAPAAKAVDTAATEEAVETADSNSTEMAQQPGRVIDFDTEIAKSSREQFAHSYYLEHSSYGRAVSADAEAEKMFIGQNLKAINKAYEKSLRPEKIRAKRNFFRGLFNRGAGEKLSSRNKEIAVLKNQMRELQEQVVALGGTVNIPVATGSTGSREVTPSDSVSRPNVQAKVIDNPEVAAVKDFSADEIQKALGYWDAAGGKAAAAANKTRRMLKQSAALRREAGITGDDSILGKVAANDKAIQDFMKKTYLTTFHFGRK